MNTPTQATPEIRPNATPAADGGIPTPSTPEQTHPHPADNGTTGLRHVRFDLSATGSVDLGDSTGLSALLELGALFGTARFDSKSGLTPRTDRRGMEILAEAGDTALESLLDGMGIVGKLLVHASDELSRQDLAKTGWLLAGLADVAQGVHNGVANVKYAMARQEADDGKR